MTTVSQPISFGPNATNTVCPSCRSNITSSMEKKANTKTHIIALVLCLVGCWPCCLIPYCMDSCKSTEHFCPNCKAYLGTYTS